MSLNIFYFKVFNEVISVNDSLAAVLAREAALKESVQALGDFDGNVTIVDTADTVTAKLIREGNLQQQATLDDIFLQANASWVRIQQFYTTCVDASARMASLLSEADGLMTEVDRSAQQRRDTLDGLNDEQQLQEREQNDQRINDIRGIHLSFDLETPVRDVSTAEGLAFTARNISNGTVGAALREVDQTTELSSEAGAASTNTSRVQQLVAATQSKSQSYKVSHPSPPPAITLPPPTNSPSHPPSCTFVSQHLNINVSEKCIKKTNLVFAF